MSVRWGVLSTAAIGSVVVGAAHDSELAEVVAVASRDRARAAAFAAAQGVATAYGSYEELLADDSVDAVYLPLPTALHVPWSIKALQAGKHVLCEKPFAETSSAVAQAFDVAEAEGRVLTEALMWRYHPRTAYVVELVAQGVIGRLQVIRSALSVTVPADDIRRDRSLGGGALLDLGTYCSSATRLFGGEPRRVFATARYDEQGNDVALAATLELPAGVLAHFDVGLDMPRRDHLELVGTEGLLRVVDPWEGTSTRIELERTTGSRRGEVETLDVDVPAGSRLGTDLRGVYTIELDTVSRAILDGTPPPYGRADAVAQARLLETLAASARERQPLDVPA